MRICWSSTFEDECQPSTERLCAGAHGGEVHGLALLQLGDPDLGNAELGGGLLLGQRADRWTPRGVPEIVRCPRGGLG